MTSRHRRRRAQRAWYPEPTCSNCGGRGRHFVPPGMGSGGFYTCHATRFGMVEPRRSPTEIAADFEAYQRGLQRRIAEACSMPLDMLLLPIPRHS